MVMVIQFLARDYNEALAAFTKAVSGCSTLEEGMRNARWVQLGDVAKLWYEISACMALDPSAETTRNYFELWCD